MDKIQIDTEKNIHIIPLGLNNNRTNQRIIKV